MPQPKPEPEAAPASANPDQHVQGPPGAATTAPAKRMFPSCQEDEANVTDQARSSGAIDGKHDEEAARSKRARLDLGLEVSSEGAASVDPPAESSSAPKEEEEEQGALLPVDAASASPAWSQRRAARAAIGRLSQSFDQFESEHVEPKRRSTPKPDRRSVGSASKMSKADMAKENQFEQDGKSWEVQFTGCNSARYKTWPKCVHCISKNPGDTCRFLGLRAIPVNADRGEPYTTEDEENDETPCFVTTRKPDQALDLPQRGSFNRPMDDRSCTRIQQTIAKSLLPILRQEVEHAKLPETLRRERETTCRQMCEYCNTSIFSASWFCKKCGREYCPDCQEALSGVADTSEAASKVRSKLETCSRSRFHTSADLIPLTRFSLDALEEEVAVMEKLSSETQPDEQRNGGSSHEPSGIADEQDETGDAEVNWSALKPLEAGIVADRIVGSRPLRRFESSEMNNELMEREWKHGEPLLVKDVLGSMQHSWGPDAFVERYGRDRCYIVRCDKEPSNGKRDDGITALTSVERFFKTFGTGQDERRREFGKGTWKLKDWPPSSDFKAIFPELYDDFNRAVPVPDYTRRDGVMNLGSCYPAGVIQPDLGPKMYNAWPSSEAPGGKGTTRLHMDMADAVNIMLYAEPPKEADLPEEHKPGVAAWDIFRAEDADKVRQFLREELDPRSEFKDDPIHIQRYFIDAELRVKLFRRYGVRGWRIYQRIGEAVFIPAGCAHQVCNLADCIKVAVDFISPENVERCFKLTSEFRQLTNDNKAWKEDVLSLRTTLWYAWCACRQMQGAWGSAVGAANARRTDDRVKMIVQEAVSPPAPDTPPPRASRKTNHKTKLEDSEDLTSLDSDSDEIGRLSKRAKSMSQRRSASKKAASEAREVQGETDNDSDYNHGSKALALKTGRRSVGGRKAGPTTNGAERNERTAAKTNRGGRAKGHSTTSNSSAAFDAAGLIAWDTMSDAVLGSFHRRVVEQYHKRGMEPPAYDE
ncbi:hypothetical protein ACQY0O_006329 [Thecaphora frezii]